MAKKADEAAGRSAAVEVTVLQLPVPVRARVAFRAARERPRVCPKCKTPNWDKPKKWERKTAD